MARVKHHPTGLRVGITQRRIEATDTSFARDALDAGWSQWFTTLWPEIPFLAIPNFENPAQALAFIEAWGVNCLILSGGEDVGQSLLRDATESCLLEYAEGLSLPVLGVCRGMQLLHNHAGGLLFQKPGHVKNCHIVRLQGTDCVVNSWHHFTIQAPTPDWESLACADDGTIEAMQHRKLPWLGVMWHPERPNGKSELVTQWMHKRNTPTLNFEAS